MFSALHAVLRKRQWRIDAALFGLALCAVPLSIAAAESLLAGSCIFRVIAPASRRTPVAVPRIFWIWLLWAASEIVVWAASPEPRAGFGEIRHLLLIAVLFFQVSLLDRAAARVTVWRGIVAAGTLNSLVLIGYVASRLLSYPPGADPVIYLRNGGLLHHWMVYATVEIVVFAATLELWHFYREEHAWLLPALSIQAVAIVLSLTRMLWICCLLVLALDWLWRRSRWIWTIPAIPCVLFLIAPTRARVEESANPEYYSNAERVQMAEVGWRIIERHPFTGVGPGRVEKLYTSYLSPGDPVPDYHGHLHNNAIQLAAEFGLPVAAVAAVFIACLFFELRRRSRWALTRDERFGYRVALLALAGFFVSGLFDYTYGHSLGLILISFATLAPLVPHGAPRPTCLMHAGDSLDLFHDFRKAPTSSGGRTSVRAGLEPRCST